MQEHRPEMYYVPVAQWLRCCATNRKVAGSIPASVIGFFVDIKSFRSHYGPGVDSASKRNEYQEHFLGVKAAGAVRLATYHHSVPLSRNLGTLTSWNPLGPSGPVTGLLYLHLLSSDDTKDIYSALQKIPCLPAPFCKEVALNNALALPAILK